MTPIRERLHAAERMEAQARCMREIGFLSWLGMDCGKDRNSDCCNDCNSRAFCADRYMTYEMQMRDLFAASKAEYEACAAELRDMVSSDPTEESMQLLAQAVLDDNCHAFQEDTPRSELFWEAQYWYLRLYFTFHKQEYLEKAKMQEAFRRAVVRCLGKGGEQI